MKLAQAQERWPKWASRNRAPERPRERVPACAPEGRREALRCIGNSGTSQKGRKSFSSRLSSASARVPQPEPGPLCGPSLLPEARLLGWVSGRGSLCGVGVRPELNQQGIWPLWASVPYTKQKQNNFSDRFAVPSMCLGFDVWKLSLRGGGGQQCEEWEAGPRTAIHCEDNGIPPWNTLSR